MSQQLSHIFKHAMPNGLTHNLYKVKGKETYLYILTRRDKVAQESVWFNGEDPAKQYVMKKTGRNPFKEVIIEKEK